MGLLDLFDAFFSRIKKNDKVHIAYCVSGVIGCLVLYGVLQVRSPRPVPQRKSALHVDGRWPDLT